MSPFWVKALPRRRARSRHVMAKSTSWCSSNVASFSGLSMACTISSICSPVSTDVPSIALSFPSTLIRGSDPVASSRSEPWRSHRIWSQGSIRFDVGRVLHVFIPSLRGEGQSAPATGPGHFGSPVNACTARVSLSDAPCRGSARASYEPQRCRWHVPIRSECAVLHVTVHVVSELCRLVSQEACRAGRSALMNGAVIRSATLRRRRVGRVVGRVDVRLDRNLDRLGVRVAGGRGALAGHAGQGKHDRCGKDAEDDDDDQEFDQGEPRLDDLFASTSRLDVAQMPKHCGSYRLSL